MQRNVVLVLAIVAALLLAGGIAVAKNVTCDGGKCVGTERRDEMIGSDGVDRQFGRGGNDVINGDVNNNGEPAGDDVIRGGAGNDTVLDMFGLNPDTDTVFGGKGDDSLNVQEFDQSVDTVDCGPGEDRVIFDPTDAVDFATCEILIS